MPEENVRKTKSKNGKNRYNLPERFPNIIKFLDMLQDDELPSKVRGTYIDGGLIVTKKEIWMLGDHRGWGEDVNGVLAGRFNCYIWRFLDGLEIYSRRLKPEIARFREWLKAEEEKREKAAELKELRDKAMDLGYILTKP